MPIIDNAATIPQPPQLGVRDFFAAAAACGLCASSQAAMVVVDVAAEAKVAKADVVAMTAYAIADAMMLARSADGKNG